MIQILIVDDHPLVGDGVKTMLREVDYLEVVKICKTAKDAILYLNENNPDIVLLDLNLPDMDGLELCAMIRKANANVKLVALTSTNESGIITRFLSKGGNGYLLKDMERADLLQAIDSVLNGKIHISPAANQKLLQQYSSVQDALRNTPVLTRRENEILQLLQEGCSGPQIAQQLNLSPYTIETHRKNLMQKLGTSTTQQLLNKARGLKLL